jgi:hypothetical protein
MVGSRIAAAPPRVVLDNQRATVLELIYAPGEKSELHEHKEDYILYALSDARIMSVRDDGKTDEINLVAGNAYFRRGESHTCENVGETEARMLIFQFNEWGP